jgi:hypothetical protein
MRSWGNTTARGHFSKGHCFYRLTNKKKGVPPAGGTPKSSEGDLLFSFGDACIERGFEKLDDFLDARRETGGEDIAV